MTGADRIEELARAPAPGFRCFPAGEPSPDRLMARVEHILHPPASAHVLDGIRRALGPHAEQPAAYYGRHNGFVLYADTLSHAAGVVLLPASEWPEATRDMRLWLEDLASGPGQDTGRITSGVAFALVPSSGNWFVMAKEGPDAGQVFYANHEDWPDAAFAKDFDSFLARIASDPVRLLGEDLGGYVRYSDGETATAWIPEAYFPDITRAER